MPPCVLISAEFLGAFAILAWKIRRKKVMAMADGSSKRRGRLRHRRVACVVVPSLALSAADDDVITNSSAYDLLTLRARPERRATRHACESGRDEAGLIRSRLWPKMRNGRVARPPEPPPPIPPSEQDVPSDRPTSTTAKRKRGRERERRYIPFLRT